MADFKARDYLQLLLEVTMNSRIKGKSKKTKTRIQKDTTQYSY